MIKSDLQPVIVEIIENLDTGIMILDSNGNFKYANDTAISLLNIHVKDIIDKRLFDLLPDKGILQVVSNVHSDITKTSVSEMKAKDTFVKITVRALDKSRFGPGAVLILIEDIDRFKKLDQIKREFIDTILHRLRTPLTTIKSSFSLLSQGHYKDVCGEICEIFDMCHSETNRLVFFLNDLRDLFLIESGLIHETLQPCYVPVQFLISKALEQVKGDCSEHDLNIKYQSKSENALVYGDEQRLTQALVNILINAITFTPSNGLISIVVQEEDNTVRLSVSDNGIGMSEEELGQIFNKYYRADNDITRSVIGNGLGLYISRCLIEQCGGKVYACSKKHEGSQFDIVFR